MANPQLEDGYIKIANEIWRALRRIRIPGEAMQILMVVIEQTYGWNLIETPISLKTFTEKTGIVKSHISRATSKLTTMNIIKVTQKGNKMNPSYCLQKDYEQWRSLPKKVTCVTQKGNNSPSTHNSTKDTIKKTVLPLSDSTTNQTVKVSKKINLFKNKIDGANTKYCEAFEVVWELHPGTKSGKRESAGHWNATIENKEDVDRIANAQNNYKSELLSKPWKKAQVGKTWFNNWQDWEVVEKDFRESNNGAQIVRRSEGGFLFYDDGSIVDEETGKVVQGGDR